MPERFFTRRKCSLCKASKKKKKKCMAEILKDERRLEKYSTKSIKRKKKKLLKPKRNVNQRESLHG